MMLKSSVYFTQRGNALLVALVLLAAMLLLGLTAFMTSRQQERFARAGRDGMVAREAAEVALRYVERQIASGSIDVDAGFSSCPNSMGNGLCSNYASGPMSVLLASAAIVANPTAVAILPDSAWHAQQLGSFSLRPPRYVVEAMPDAAAGSDLNDVGHVYRITAWGFGYNSNIVYVAETVYRPQP